MSKVQTRPPSSPWWLAGEELCLHCGQLYAYEIEFRCPDCDGPSCPHCRVLHLGRYVCPVCVEPDTAKRSNG